jgi:transcriptional regulator with XRE-family HTH domain
MKELNVATRVGQAMRDARKSLELSQDDFADHIDMHRAYYGAIERGEKNITLQTLHRVATGLGTTMAELLEGID